MSDYFLLWIRDGRKTVEMESSFVADSTLIQALEQRSVPLPCLRGLMLFRQGDLPIGLYIIRSGEAMLLLTDENGNEVAQFDVGAGSILGLPAVVANEPYSLSAMVRERSQVSFVEIAVFEELMREQPSLFPKVLEVLAAEVRSARNALTGILGRLASRPSRVM
jgi:CRP-like cAMP-binding protein